jgi:hypothetical protein
VELNNMQIKLLSILLIIIFLTACSEDGYRVEGRKVVYEAPWNTGNLTVIHDLEADPKTFEVLGNDNLNWAKDKKTVYWVLDVN